MAKWLTAALNGKITLYLTWLTTRMASPTSQKSEIKQKPPTIAVSTSQKDMPFADAGKKRYWRSKNLKLPEKIYNKTLNDVFADYAHLIDMTKGSHFQNDHLETTTFTITGKNTLTIHEK